MHIEDFGFRYDGEITSQFADLGMDTFYEAADFIWRIPYGRNQDRSSYMLVIPENKGTCSTKHALLAALCEEQDMPIKLKCGIYDMNEENTPGVGRVLLEAGLSSIPEAHCYLSKGEEKIDITKYHEQVKPFSLTISKEMIISPNQIGDVKLQFHQDYIMGWIKTLRRPYSFHEVWRIREACIKALSSEEKTYGSVR
jgi:hypothetical protein